MLQTSRVLTILLMFHNVQNVQQNQTLKKPCLYNTDHLDKTIFVAGGRRMTRIYHSGTHHMKLDIERLV